MYYERSSFHMRRLNSASYALHVRKQVFFHFTYTGITAQTKLNKWKWKAGTKTGIYTAYMAPDRYAYMMYNAGLYNAISKDKPS